jgi:pentatricopeptide repeat protein
MMKDDYLNNGNRMAKPNVQSFNTLIDTYSKSISSSQNYDSLEGTIDAPDEAELLLNDMIDLYSRGELKGNGPDIYSYNGVINCWSKSNQPNSPQRAFDILQSMRSRNDNNNNNRTIKPDTITYNSVLDAYARHGDVEGANKVWEMMKEDSYTAKPNVRTYSILIDAWSKSASASASAASGTVGSASTADNNNNIIIDSVERLFNEMNNRYVNGDLGEEGGPNEITYTSMIQCLENFHGTEKRIEELKTLRNNIIK